MSSPASEGATPRTLRPALATAIPGPRSAAMAERLARVESPDVTCLVPAAPIFWERAAGANVWDVDGNRFVDLTGAFGVANAGHAADAVVQALRDQAGRLLHGMGDVHPPAVKVEMLEALTAVFPGGGPARAVLGSSGSDAVESAIKTALIHSGRAGLVAFDGAYHGLSLGALDATFRNDFRAPFAARLPAKTRHARFGEVADVAAVARDAEAEGLAVGAVIVEPVQGRGGERVPPRGFLKALRALCDAQDWLLIADEIYTGMGRTGRLFACEHEGVVPDLLCVGKGLASGLPISACVGRAEIMESWPASRGEALHTQTFIGHPLGCAAALASMSIIAEQDLPARAARIGARALERLRDRLSGHPNVRDVRGLCLMIGIECQPAAVAQRVCIQALREGVILLPSGPAGEVLSITPPLTIEEETLSSSIDLVCALLEREGAADS